MVRILGFALVVLAAVACNASPNRIIGGTPTTIENYASVAQVDSQGVITGLWSQFCACSILNSRHILSAAQCFSGFLYAPRYRRVRAGTTFRNQGGILVLVEREINHPSYGTLGFDGDVTVVRLSQTIVYTPVIQQAVIVAQDTALPDNLPVTVVGWGTIEDGSASTELRETVIYTINNDLCRQRYIELTSDPGIVTENMICAGILDVGGRDACQGDSGGPLYFDDIVIAMVSWGHGCANGTYPGVNIAVAPYTDWIIEAVESP